MGHITSECFHITDAVLDGSGSGLRSSGSEPEVPFPSRAVLGSVTEGCVMLGGGCIAEQDSAHGCRSEEHLWRAVLALPVKRWGTYSAGNHKPLRAAFVLAEGVGAAVPAGVWCCTGRYWWVMGRCWQEGVTSCFRMHWQGWKD